MIYDDDNVVLLFAYYYVIVILPLGLCLHTEHDTHSNNQNFHRDRQKIFKYYAVL